MDQNTRTMDRFQENWPVGIEVVSQPRAVIVVAVARNGVIGDGRGVPWNLPLDLHWFRWITWGKLLVWGRRTYETLPRRLPGRVQVVLSRQAIPSQNRWNSPIMPLPNAMDWQKQVELASSLEETAVFWTKEPVAIAQFATALAHRPTSQNQYFSDRHEPLQLPSQLAPLQSFCAAVRNSRQEWVVGGGGAIYSLFFPFVSRVYLTRLYAEAGGNVYFDWPLKQPHTLRQPEWECVFRLGPITDSPIPFGIEIWDRNEEAVPLIARNSSMASE